MKVTFDTDVLVSASDHFLEGFVRCLAGEPRPNFSPRAKGWDAADRVKQESEPQDAFSYADKESDSTDHHQHSWDLAEALSEIVRGEVEKQVRALSGREERTGEILARELGPNWMARIEILEDKTSDLIASRRREHSELEQRISDLETTLERLEGLDEENSYVTTHDCDKLRWPDGFDAEYLSHVPQEVRQAAMDAAMKLLDDNVEWVGPSPAAGPWKEGFPSAPGLWLVKGPEINTAVAYVRQAATNHRVAYVRDIYGIRLDSNTTNISHHARIYLPETTDD